MSAVTQMSEAEQIAIGLLQQDEALALPGLREWVERLASDPEFAEFLDDQAERLPRNYRVSSTTPLWEAIAENGIAHEYSDAAETDSYYRSAARLQVRLGMQVVHHRRSGRTDTLAGDIVRYSTGRVKIALDYANALHDRHAA